jgi:PKHD-type hydroxylase
MSNYPFSPSPSVYESQTATWENGFSDADISWIVRHGDSLVQGAGVIDSNVTDPAIRKSRTSWIGCDSDTLWLYERMAWIARQTNGKFFGFDLHGFVEDFQYTTYEGPSDHYTWHMDAIQGGDSPPRKLSLVLQLSGEWEYEGGDLEYMVGDKPMRVQKKRGLVVAFPAWLLHRVTPIVSGTRKTLVIWTSGPAFR